MMQQVHFFFLCIIFVLSTFGLLSFNRCGVVHLLIATFDLCGGDSDR